MNLLLAQPGDLFRSERSTGGTYLLYTRSPLTFIKLTLFCVIVNLEELPGDLGKRAQRIVVSNQAVLDPVLRNIFHL